METLDGLITYGIDSRETKRALSVKVVQNGMAPKEISHLLNVSQQYVSKWKGIYERQGVEGLRLGYQGKEALLKPEQRAVVVEWIKGYETLRVEEVGDYVESHYGVVYGSKQSYYDLLSEGGMSYHHSEGVNPKRDEGQVLQKREEIKKSGTTQGRD